MMFSGGELARHEGKVLLVIILSVLAAGIVVGAGALYTIMALI